MGGTGTFGTVHYGTYRSQEVAIKKLHPAGGTLTDAQYEEFIKEVATLSALSHPRLVSFIGASFEPPCMCIVTEFMPNCNLYDLLHKSGQPLTAVERASLATHVAEGIEFLHTR